MEGIINLIRGMQIGEIKLLKHLFKLQHNYDTKKFLLFEQSLRFRLCKDFAGIEKKIMRELYPNDKNSLRSFEKLKIRLRTDILNVLLLQESSIKSKSKHEMAVFECRRLIMQGDILIGRGLYHEGIELLEKASVIADKNELYNEQLLIDNLYSTYHIEKPKDSMPYLGKEKVKGVKSMLEKLLHAKQFYEELSAPELVSGNGAAPFEEWQKKLDSIKNDCAPSGSARILFYYNLSALQFFRHRQEYDKSLYHATLLLKQEECNDLFKTCHYTGLIHLQAARCFLHVGQYDNAIYHASYSADNFGHDMLNILTSHEILFYCYFHLKDYKKANEIIGKAFFNSYLQQDEFSRAKWWFLRAALEFRMKDYKSATCSMKTCIGLYKGKCNWLITFSLFEAVCRIENGDLEWLDLRSEGLKKIMLRHNKSLKENNNKRMSLVYHVLRTLNRNNYDYRQTLSDEKDNMNLLSEGSGVYSWNLAGSELIRFDEWISQKADSSSKNTPPAPKLVA